MSLPKSGTGPCAAARALGLVLATAWSLLGAGPPCVDLRGPAPGVEAIEDQLAIGPVKSSTAAECLRVQVEEEGPAVYQVRHPSEAAGGLSAAAAAAQIEAWLAGRAETRVESAPSTAVRIGAAATVGLAGDEGPWVGVEVRLAGRLGPVSPFLQVNMAEGTTEARPSRPYGGFDAVALLGVGWPLARGDLEVQPYLGLGLGHLATPTGFPTLREAPFLEATVVSLRAELGLGVTYALSPLFGLSLKVALTYLPDPSANHDGPLTLWSPETRPLFRGGLGVHFDL